jgi:methylphosphotriester-DNA--protein-cysteine methyltransferase
MTVTIELHPETAAGLAALAAEQGVSVSEYVRRVLEHQAVLSPSDRATAWRHAATGLPHAPPLSDEAISRESIYDAHG